MVHVETIDLSSRNVVLPSDRVGMVVAQPYLSLSAVEPFCCTVATKAEQLAAVTRTLEISRGAHHGAEKTHFTIFPEYSIPGVDGIQAVQESIEAAAWPTGTIVIGGTDALTKLEFVALCSAPNTHSDTVGNNLERVADDAWINCKITWVKGADGNVERWLQPKLSPAWLELNVEYQNMFRGNSIYTFRGRFTNDTLYRFCSLVCFDWIAIVENKKVWQWVLEHLHNQATNAGGQFALSWFFVVQRNPQPSHNTFLTEVGNFFNQTVLPNVRRGGTCLLFANGAGKSGVGKTDNYGHTGLIFSPQSLFKPPGCSPTFSNGGARFRDSTLLQGYHDVLFRERGSCVHSFAQVNPDSLSPGPAGRTIVLQNTAVFPLNGVADKRAPSASVPAAIKWWNDELDNLPKLSARYPAAPLAQAASANHDQNVGALREVAGHSAFGAIKLAAQQSIAKNADEWATIETQALENLVNTLNILSLGSPAPTVGADPAHATVTIRNQSIDIVAIMGGTHEQCLKHSQDIVPKQRRQMLMVSRDPDNNRWSAKYGSFLKAKSARLGEERKITDPADGMLHIGYRNLLELFQNNNTVTAVQGAIDAELAA
jgi:hypothetical protein